MSKEKGKLKNISRRDLLIGGSSGVAALASLPPISKLLEVIIKDLSVKSAHAAESQPAPLFYMPIFIYGAPARWCFDHLLATKASDLPNIIVNPTVATTLSSSNGVFNSTSYSTFDYKGVPVPQMWNYIAQTSQGSSSISALLDHLIVFRGYGTGVDGHLNNLTNQLTPISGSGSVPGVVGDQSKSLFRVLQTPYSFPTGFSSPNGNGLTIINYVANQNLIMTLLKSFSKKPENQNLVTLRDKYKKNYDNTRYVLKQLSKTTLAPKDSISIDYQKAVQKIESSVEDLTSVWSKLFEKYHTLLITAHKDRTQGVSSMPVPVQSDPGTEVNPWAMEAYGAIYPTPGIDLRDTVNNVSVAHIAAQFALAEYVATRRLSAAFEMVLDRGADNLEVPTQRTAAGGNLSAVELRKFPLLFDQHVTGSISTVFYNTLFFRGIAACVLEMVQVLKAQNLFNTSFIQFVSEFGRTPRDTQGGSDHGFDNMISSVITGAQNSKPIILGNILKNGIGGPYSGTFGYKSPTNVNGKIINLRPESVTSTLANIMNLPSNPWKNSADPLIEKGSGQLVVKASGDIV